MRMLIPHRMATPKRSICHRRMRPLLQTPLKRRRRENCPRLQRTRSTKRKCAVTIRKRGNASMDECANLLMEKRNWRSTHCNYSSTTRATPLIVGLLLSSSLLIARCEAFNLVYSPINCWKQLYHIVCYQQRGSIPIDRLVCWLGIAITRILIYVSAFRLYSTISHLIRLK